MERTSSLDLFRGSDAFTSLAFLDGQEPNHEANSGTVPAEGLEPSQAIPASMPVSSLHSAAPSQRPSKLLHTSRLAPGFSAWPQTASSLYPSVAMQQPATTCHTSLPFGPPPSQHAAGTADGQADSFAALLADDTALGFADDCFRRESDLYLSQDRAVAAETAHPIALPSNGVYSSPAEQPQDGIPSSAPSAANSPAAQSAASELLPHAPANGRPAAVTASARSAPLHPPDIAPVSQRVASAQPPLITSFENPSPPALEGISFPAAHASITAADAHADRTAAVAHSFGAEPQATWNQLQRADQNMQPHTPGPTQVELQTSIRNGRAHTAQASASSSLVAAPVARDAAASHPGASKSTRSELAEPLQRPPQHSAVTSPECATASSNAPDSSAQPSLEDAHPHTTHLQITATESKADLPSSAAGDSQAAQQAGQLQHAPQVQGSISQQQKLGDSHTAVVRPKLAVQDYQPPLLQTARDVPDSEAQSQQDRRQPTQPAPDAAASQGVHTCLPCYTTVSQHRGGLTGM